MRTSVHLFFTLTLVAILNSCTSPSSVKKSTTDQSVKKETALRIVSLKGAFSETIASFGMANQLVGVDVTSTYPEEVAKLPKVGHNRNISTEGIIGLRPNLIIADPEDIKPETLEQLKSSGIKVALVKLEHSPSGSKKAIYQLAEILNVSSKKASQLSETIDSNITEIKKIPNPPKVLFIYARGAGTLMVAGENTQMDQMIQLAGGKNAVHGFSDFKPLTSEALVAANPDAVLLFTSGAQSLNGIEGISLIPGMKETNAGKNNQYIMMEGQYLAGFGPRVGHAAKELNNQLIQLQQNNANAE